MRKALLFISVMLLTGSVAMAQKQWTLQDCIDYAMANNITLQKSKLQKESATEDLKGAKADYLGNGLFNVMKDGVRVTLSIGEYHESIPSRRVLDCLDEVMEKAFN